MFPFLSAFTVTVSRHQRDAFGDVTGTSTHTIGGCALLRHSTSDDRELRDQVLQNAVLAMPSGADITAYDEVTLPDGSSWHVAGRPYTPHSPLTGWEPARAVPVRRVTG